MNVDHGLGRRSSSLRAWALPVSLAVLVVAFAAGSSSIPEVKTNGLHVRWVVLLAVLVVVAARAWERLSRERRRPSGSLVRFALLAGTFVGLALVSAGWSVAAKLTVERSVSLGILFAVGALLAYATEGDERERRRALEGLAGGAIAVGLLGLVMLVVDRAHAIQHTTATTPWRYRGFTENPNTISVLAAVSLPIIGWLVLTADRPRVRLAWILGGITLLGSVIAAESRGGLLACGVGLAIVCIAQVRPWQRLLVVLVTLAAIIVGGIQLRALTDPGQAAFVSITPPSPGGGGSGGGIKGVHLTHKTYELPGADSEIGHPLLSRSAASLSGSGRVAEWKGVLKQVEVRPLLGYGFGTEEKVFVDRWYYFQGGTAENSYLGILLQLGALGLLMLGGLGVLLIVAAVRALRRTPLDRRGEVAAELGVLGAAASLMLIQSYIYSVGNVATAIAWISLFLLGSRVLGKAADVAPA